MQKVLRFLLVFVLVTPMASLASHHEGEEHGHHDDHHGEEKKELTADEQREKNLEFVKHHTKDSYDFGIVTDESEGKHYGFPLPVILWDDGIHFFLSSAFHHGHDVVESNGNYYMLNYHGDGKIYKCDEHGNILTKEVKYKEKEEIKDEATGELKTVEVEKSKVVKLMPLDFSITKNVFVTILMCVVLFLVFRGVAKSYRSGLAPSGSAKFFEPIIMFVRDEIAIPNIGDKHYKKYMPYLLTVFFFIWFLNLAGMTPLGINVTGNIALTSALAILTYLITTFTAKKDYWMHIFWMPGVPWPMKIILAPIELLGTIIKPFALMIRLYANMLAGHLVLGALIAAVFYFNAAAAKGAFVGLTFFLNMIELLVALLQAYIFTMLTALYFGSASEEHDHAHAH